jgi:uncharacterized protein (TIGR03067 family)
MKPCWITAILVASTCALLAEDKKPADDQKKLLGAWKIVAMEENGKASDDFKDAVLTMQEGKYTIQTPDGEVLDGTYKVNSSAKPKEIDFVPNFGRNKGKTTLGIYALEGDTLKICRDDAGKPRPKEFATRPDTGLIVFVLKRHKP